MLGVHQEKRAPFSLARSHAPDLPQRCRSARVKLRWRCAALRAPLHCAPFLRPAGRATRGSGKKAFGHPFPQGRGENDLFWHQFSGQSRLKEGLVCPGRCQPSALKKSRFFVLPSEPLYPGHCQADSDARDGADATSGRWLRRQTSEGLAGLWHGPAALSTLRCAPTERGPVGGSSCAN